MPCNFIVGLPSNNASEAALKCTCLQRWFTLWDNALCHLQSRILWPSRRKMWPVPLSWGCDWMNAYQVACFHLFRCGTTKVTLCHHWWQLQVGKPQNLVCINFWTKRCFLLYWFSFDKKTRFKNCTLKMWDTEQLGIDYGRIAASSYSNLSVSAGEPIECRETVTNFANIRGI